MAILRLSLVLLAACLVAACGSPSIGNGEVVCGSGGLCPPGFSCKADNRCYKTGGPEFDAPPDGSMAVCGDEIVEPPETCDPPASCPTDCSDGNACTVDTLVGLASACNVVCMRSYIEGCVDGDGCCPEACSSANDSDCSATCGDGSIDPGETCDPPASCPTSCNDGNACTNDRKTGSPANCNVACSFEPITSWVAGDGCCPPGCNANADSDCSATCGNGTIETGETCDPPSSCPTSCDDMNACTVDTKTGSPTNCNVSCSHTPIVTCAHNDGCCPPGCTSNNDNNCSPTCGNGTIETGETCDPPSSCPTSCDDLDPCTIDTMTGSAANCNVQCSYSDITTCGTADGCCPDTCGDGSMSDIDPDCGVTCGGCGLFDGCCDCLACPSDPDCTGACDADGGAGFCGDGFCDALGGEDELNCPADCMP